MFEIIFNFINISVYKSLTKKNITIIESTKSSIKKVKKKWIKKLCKDIKTLDRKCDSFHKKIKEMIHTYEHKTPAKLDGNNKLIID